MNRIIGLDLGTTHSCMACVWGGEPLVIPNSHGDPTTPSVVGFAPEEDHGPGSQLLIGTDAVRQSLIRPESTIYAIKRLIGRKYEEKEIQEAAKKLSFSMNGAPNGDILIRLPTRRVSPQEVSGYLLRYLKECATSHLGEDVTQVVITVPAHFNDHQRHATKDAAKIAGWDVLRMINEPTAAGLAYGLNQKKSGLVAVYDLGGGTFDITLLDIKEGVFHVLSTNGNTFLGGEDFDNRIIEWLLKEIKQELGQDLSGDNLILQRLKEAAEKAKCELSNVMETTIRLPFIGTSQAEKDENFERSLSRETLENLTRDLVENTFSYVDEALSSARIELKDIEDLILIGGQTRMPLIRRLVSEYFGKQPVEGVNPDETVAMGAAIQGNILKGETSEQDLVLLLDVTPFSLGIETENNRFVKIIDKNTTIPTNKTMAFTTVEDDQRIVRVHVLQGENPEASKNTSLGTFQLRGLGSVPAGVPRIDVTFEIDADGLVRVSARDLATSQRQAIQINPSSGLSPKELDEIIITRSGREEDV